MDGLAEPEGILGRRLPGGNWTDVRCAAVLMEDGWAIKLALAVRGLCRAGSPTQCLHSFGTTPKPRHATVQLFGKLPEQGSLRGVYMAELALGRPR
jgi:hypothetical protein